MCNGDDLTFPLERASAALTNDSIALPAVLGFRHALKARACSHGEIIASDFYDELAKVADRQVWGRAQSLPDYLASYFAKRWGFSASNPPNEFTLIATSLVDQATRRLGTDRTAYDPNRRTDSGGVASLIAYLKSDRKRFTRAMAKAGKHLALDETIEDLASTPAQRDGLVAATRLHVQLHTIVCLQDIRRPYELDLLRLCALQTKALAPETLRFRNFCKALEIVELGLRGENGISIRLDARIGGDREAPPVDLGIRVTPVTAASRFNVPEDATSNLNNKQIPNWLDMILKQLAQNPDHAVRAATLVKTSLELRAHEYDLLNKLTPVVADLSGADIDARAKQWRGEPTRIPGLSANEQNRGYGIANVPFLFSLVGTRGGPTQGLTLLREIMGG